MDERETRKDSERERERERVIERVIERKGDKERERERERFERFERESLLREGEGGRERGLGLSKGPSSRPLLTLFASASLPQPF